MKQVSPLKQRMNYFHNPSTPSSFSISNLIAVLLLPIVLFNGCTNASQPSEKNKQPAQIELKQHELSAKVISELLPSLIKEEPMKRTKGIKPTIFPFHKYLYVDSALVDHFIKMGADSNIESLTKNRSAWNFFPQMDLKGNDRFDISYLVPMTTAEFQNNIGTIAFSQLRFNTSKTEVMFVFDFHQTMKRRTSAILGYIEAELSRDKWTVTTQITIPKGNYTLIE